MQTANTSNGLVLIFDEQDEDDYSETCDGCGQPGATCEYDGFVFHNTECWGKAERAFHGTREGARFWLRQRIAAAFEEGFYDHQTGYKPGITW